MKVSAAACDLEAAVQSQKENTSMGVDHSNAFVTLTFDGLISMCINRSVEPNRCELGMVHVQDHSRQLTITRINRGGVEEAAYPTFDLNDNSNVVIRTEHPIVPGVSIFRDDGFNRHADRGDPEDFRWIMDLQGSEFHGPNLTLDRQRGHVCHPKLVIYDGVFYTHSKTPHRYFRHPREGNPVNTGFADLGKIADKVGADIVADPTRGKVIVEITGATPDHIELQSDGLLTRYRIDVSNLCRPLCPDISDFPHYYSVASDRTGVEFDIYPEIQPYTPGFKKQVKDFLLEKTGFDIEVPKELEKLLSNGPPEVCSVASFGLSDTIPQ
jgi:hypothetical protein